MDNITSALKGKSKAITIPTGTPKTIIEMLTPVTIDDLARMITVYIKGDLAITTPIGAYTQDESGAPSVTNGQPIYTGDAIDITPQQFERSKFKLFVATEAWAEQFQTETVKA